ncbi:MAG: DUF2442 domain-containing protein [Bacteroidales bacterium]|nr:DUF2442 domain-containing protein [Bacteroidales bacterium]
MEQIRKIWFEGDWLYGTGDDGKTYRQSLLWYKGLMEADEEARNRYDIGHFGIHWRELDVDVSFESFTYADAEPRPFQRFFLTHPEINVAGFAQRIGMNATLLRNYINGFKKPSPEREQSIIEAVRALGKELASV